MPKYLITFPSHAMDDVPVAAMADVALAARAVVHEAIDAGVYVVAGGLEDRPASLVAIDGTVVDGPRPDAVSGITVVDVPSHADAVRWASKIAAACRCTQEVRAIGFDPELETMLRESAGRRSDDV